MIVGKNYVTVSPCGPPCVYILLSICAFCIPILILWGQTWILGKKNSWAPNFFQVVEKGARNIYATQNGCIFPKFRDEHQEKNAPPPSPGYLEHYSPERIKHPQIGYRLFQEVKMSNKSCWTSRSPSTNGWNPKKWRVINIPFQDDGFRLAIRKIQLCTTTKKNPSVAIEKSLWLSSRSMTWIFRLDDPRIGWQFVKQKYAQPDGGDGLMVMNPMKNQL